ncbi:uncharacterized protein LOC142587155 [Dermacentor variabilis]|uniref:uncharacterized protein LOC142587155 n=1 Tax=Dermacentor variabilis TaxID=34621 RepID=UPI003F5B3051
MFCKMFNHTICGGVGNAFRSELKCQEMCLPKQKPEVFCSKPPKPGRCFLAKKRFYFDDKKNACLMFPNNKCGSNRNGFSKLEKCVQRCSYIKSTKPCPTCEQKMNNELPYGGTPGVAAPPKQLGPNGQAGYPSAPSPNALPGQPSQPTLTGQSGLPGHPVVAGLPGNAVPTGLPTTPGQPNQPGSAVLPGQNLTPGKAAKPAIHS